MKQTIASKKDFKVDYFRCSGSGGQHVNKTSTGVRITHLPSGLVSECTETRSQAENKKRAFQKLGKKVAEWHFGPKEDKERFASTKVVRTYNQCDDRVKDHDSGEVYSFKDIILTGKKSKIEEMLDSRLRHTSEST